MEFYIRGQLRIQSLSAASGHFKFTPLDCDGIMTATGLQNCGKRIQSNHISRTSPWRAVFDEFIKESHDRSLDNYAGNDARVPL